MNAPDPVPSGQPDAPQADVRAVLARELQAVRCGMTRGEPSAADVAVANRLASALEAAGVLPTWEVSPASAQVLAEQVVALTEKLARVEALLGEPVYATWTYPQGQHGEANAVQSWRIRRALHPSAPTDLGE